MNELTYSRNGDYLIPDIAIQETQPLSKYGMMRKSYLRDHRRIVYNQLLLTEKLFSHCLEIEQTATERMTLMMKDLVKQSPPPDKAINPMGWTAHMNSLREQAEETILNELIYS